MLPDILKKRRTKLSVSVFLEAIIFLAALQHLLQLSNTAYIADSFLSEFSTDSRLVQSNTATSQLLAGLTLENTDLMVPVGNSEYYESGFYQTFFTDSQGPFYCQSSYNARTKRLTLTFNNSVSSLYFFDFAELKYHKVQTSAHYNNALYDVHFRRTIDDTFTVTFTLHSD